MTEPFAISSPLYLIARIIVISGGGGVFLSVQNASLSIHI